jgi:membrane-bound metal-dependent hydrolase YbcI (DUF457 family)
MATSVQIVEISTLRYIPEIAAWAFGIVLAVLMVRRGGSKAEKLLLAGCALMFALEILSMVFAGMMPWIREQRISAQEVGIINSLVIGLPSLAGFVCLILAYWFRFRRRRVLA